MNFFQQLKPLEQRIVIVTAVILFIMANAFWVWPHFGDLQKAKDALKKAQTTHSQQEKKIGETPKWEAMKKKLEGAGSVLSSEQMAVNLQRIVDEQAATSGLLQNNINPGGASSAGNGFEERVLQMGYTANDKELVDFLYNLGANKAMIRVRDITIKPDPSFTKLQGNVTLVATYQKAASTPKPAAGTPKTGTNTTSAPKVQPPKTGPAAPPNAAPTNTVRPPRDFKSKM